MASEANSESDGTQQGQPSPRGAELIPDVSTISGQSHCPRCGDAHVRKRGWLASCLIGVVSFVLITIVAFVVLQWVQYHVAQVQWRRGLRAVSLGFMLPYSFALAVVWSRLLADCRCLKCGRHFHAIQFLDRPKTEWPFPLRFCVLNAIILFVSLVVSQQTVWLISRGAVSIIFVESVLIGIGAAFLAGGSLVYHMIVYVFMRRQITRELLWAMVFVLPAVALGHIPLHQSFPFVEAGILLSNAELSSLPASARDVKAYHWSSPFSGEEYLRFVAEPNDIQAFLDNSPALEGKVSQPYRIERVYVPVPEDEAASQGQEVGQPEVLLPHPNGPHWYRPRANGPTRRYEIQPEGYYYPGEVLVDDEQHVVYVYLIFS